MPINKRVSTTGSKKYTGIPLYWSNARLLGGPYTGFLFSHAVPRAPPELLGRLHVESWRSSGKLESNWIGRFFTRKNRQLWTDRGLFLYLCTPKSQNDMDNLTQAMRNLAFWCVFFCSLVYWTITKHHEDQPQAFRDCVVRDLVTKLCHLRQQPRNSCSRPSQVLSVF